MREVLFKVGQVLPTAVAEVFGHRSDLLIDHFRVALGMENLCRPVQRADLAHHFDALGIRCV
ncbi:hypothetical protein D3C84_1192530 [compost metagenome]